jgi:hypothetical protein
MPTKILNILISKSFVLKKLFFVLFCTEFVLIKLFIINYLTVNSTKKQKNSAQKNLQKKMID